MRALVIDDSKAIRLILTKHLRELGFEVDAAEHGQQALDVLQPGTELALVDWNMPVMNGIEFVRAVRKQPAHDGMRLMMVTTETELERMVEALEAGANEYVMKPFTRDVLAEKLSLLGLAA